MLQLYQCSQHQSDSYEDQLRDIHWLQGQTANVTKKKKKTQIIIAEENPTGVQQMHRFEIK